MSVDTQTTGNVSEKDIELAEKYKNEANDHFKSMLFFVNTS